MNSKRTTYTGLIVILVALISCHKREKASEVLVKTINAIDTINTIYYKQDMSRTNPRSMNDTIFRYREMYFERLITDSIVGVKGHWYMYVDDKVNVIYEDIYDGKRLIRKNNKDSIARIYDLVQFPDFRKDHFWSHNTLYGMQYELKHVLDNMDTYSIERLNDTITDGKNCYHIELTLEDKMTMPGFATKLEDKKGNIWKTQYFIDKETNLSIRMHAEFYSTDKPDQKAFIDQQYYDFKFNSEMDDEQFNTTAKTYKGYDIRIMEPK